MISERLYPMTYINERLPHCWRSLLDKGTETLVWKSVAGRAISDDPPRVRRAEVEAGVSIQETQCKESKA